ncbi:phage portal protein [Candidatus Pacearchaeota archaeon]|nr:phage portal protein [Candidatus Pacearchaeota archaeon]
MGNKRRKNRKVKKTPVTTKSNPVAKRLISAVTAEDVVQPDRHSRREEEGRGFNIYSLSDLTKIKGRGQHGGDLEGYAEKPYFDLTIDERVEMVRKSSPVFGVVTNRMNRISALDWEIVPAKNNEERLVEEMRFRQMIINEYANATEPQYVMKREESRQELLTALPELLPDLSNFEGSLLRWKRRMQYDRNDQASEIEDWLKKPNRTHTWTEFIKLWVFDLHTHGAGALYKEQINGMVENLYVLPGGTVIPLKDKFVGGIQAYAQITENYQTQVFHNNEISFSQYLPTTYRSYPLIPMEALINKVAETLFFDKLMAEQADGTKPPEKMIVFNDKAPFGDFDEAANVPLNKGEQRRIETLANEERKNAVRLLTGYGEPTILDLSRENTMPISMERQKMIREEVALVFNMSNMEVNLTGSESVSGRSTAEAQAEIEFGKGIQPIMQIIDNKLNLDVIPFRWGNGYKFEFKQGRDEMAEIKKNALLVSSGLKAVNEVRTKDMNELPFPDKQFDQPQQAAPPVPPDGSVENPLFTTSK